MRCVPASCRKPTSNTAANIGKLFRGGDAVLTPNPKWIPIGCQGRVSGIGVSGQAFRRPMGQAMPLNATGPVHGSCARLDRCWRHAAHPHELQAPVLDGLADGGAPHTVGGCKLQAGDLLGSGTISGPTIDQAGAMIELSAAGRNPLTLEFGNGQTDQRGFPHGGDAVILKGWCEKTGHTRIGFGENRGTVLPSIGA